MSIGLLLLVAGSMTACSRNYWKSRACDAADIFLVELSAGPGIHGFVQATDLAGTGLGWSRQYAVGVHGRRRGIYARDAGGLAMISVSDSEQMHTKVLLSWEPAEGLSDSEGYEYREWIADGNGGATWIVLPMGLTIWRGDVGAFLRNTRHRLLDLSVGASLGIGFQVGLSPGEVADSLLGWMAIDIAGDDFGGEERATMRANGEAPNPGEAEEGRGETAASECEKPGD